MIEIVFVACLQASPSECHKTEPAFFDGSMMECVLYGQHAAQDWLALHPKYEVRGWRCQFSTGERHT